MTIRLPLLTTQLLHNGIMLSMAFYHHLGRGNPSRDSYDKPITVGAKGFTGRLDTVEIFPG